MEVMFFITVLGGIILTVGYLPQIFKLYQTGNTDGISLLFWYFIFSAVSITAINLILTAAPVILIVIQLSNALLAAVVVGMVYYYKDQFKFVVMVGFLTFVLTVLVVSLPIEVTQTTSTVLIVAAYVIQLITLIKAESVQGVSAWLFLLIALGLGIMATKMFITEVSIHIIITEIVNISLLIACAAITFYFQHREINKLEIN